MFMLCTLWKFLSCIFIHLENVFISTKYIDYSHYHLHYLTFSIWNILNFITNMLLKYSIPNHKYWIVSKTGFENDNVLCDIPAFISPFPRFRFLLQNHYAYFKQKWHTVSLGHVLENKSHISLKAKMQVD